jgi:hypothetical protein
MPMLSILLPILLLPQDESPRLRTRLDNGAVILVERMPSAKTLSVQLFASSRGTEESEATTGRRHLLEHLLSRPMLEERLETLGGFLNMRTLRDATVLDITAGATQLDLALDTLRDLLKPIDPTPEQLEKEKRVVREEIVLMGEPQRLAMAAWKAGYGAAGLDPIGSVEGISEATNEEMKALQRRQFSSDGLVLVICGNVSLQDATLRAKALLQPKKVVAGPAAEPRGRGVPGRSDVVGIGEARGAFVGSYRDPETMATLAAAFAIASEFGDSFVSYTPTALNSMIVVGKTDGNSGLGRRVDALTAGDASRMFSAGKQMAQLWLDRQLADPHQAAFLRGLLLIHGEAQRPEIMSERIAEMTQDQFIKALDLFKEAKAAVAVGSR